MVLSMMHDAMVAIWWVIMIGLLIGVAVAVAALLRRSPSPRRPSALDALRERYAAGDIDDEEYRRRRGLLDER